MNAPSATTEAHDWTDRKVYGSDGAKIGSVEEVYLDTASEQPEWVAVHTGLFGTKRSFVPIAGATLDGEDVRVACTKDEVKRAPGIKPGEELNESEEQQLWSHYGIEHGNGGERRGGDRDASADAGRDSSGPDAAEAMTRSEEEVETGTVPVHEERVETEGDVSR